MNSQGQVRMAVGAGALTAVVIAATLSVATRGAQVMPEPTPTPTQTQTPTPEPTPEPTVSNELYYEVYRWCHDRFLSTENVDACQWGAAAMTVKMREQGKKA